MRGVAGTLVALCVIGYLASTVGQPHLPQSTASGDSWRRTAQGWEDIRQWRQQDATSAAAMARAARNVHPLTIAALQVLVSLFALLLATVDEHAHPRGSGGRPRASRHVLRARSRCRELDYGALLICGRGEGKRGGSPLATVAERGGQVQRPEDAAQHVR